MTTQITNPVRGSELSADDGSQFVPAHVCLCPECGGRIWWQASPEDGFEDLSLDCENEPDIDALDESEHRHWQSEWMPVVDKVRGWLLANNRDVGRDDSAATKQLTD